MIGLPKIGGTCYVTYILSTFMVFFVIEWQKTSDEFIDEPI